MDRVQSAGADLRLYGFDKIVSCPGHLKIVVIMINAGDLHETCRFKKVQVVTHCRLKAIPLMRISLSEKAEDLAAIKPSTTVVFGGHNFEYFFSQRVVSFRERILAINAKWP